MIRVILPPHLRILAKVDGEVTLSINGPVTQQSVLDALEAHYPMLLGTIRHATTHTRRPMLRFFACKKDFSNEAPDTPYPDDIATGKEPLIILGAIAGG